MFLSFAKKQNMMKGYMNTVFILFLLGTLAYGNEKEYQQAKLRARLAKAKSIQEALIILRTSSKNGPMAMISADSIKREQEEIVRTAQELNDDLQPTTVPRNGGCEPRIICEEVPVDRTSSNNMMSFPQCLEVHRCGGCCQEPQFPCVPIGEEPVTFSPLLLVSLDDDGRYEVKRPLKLMNHTKCECKCNIDPAQCRQQGEILDARLCQCIKPHCNPECLISSTCSVVEGSELARCTCRRRLQGQRSNFCQNPKERPDRTCTRCESAFG